MPASNFYTLPIFREDYKCCRKCGLLKPLPFFPKDRSRPDGRWHTCRACNRKHWREQGRARAAAKRAEARPQRQTFEGIAGLRRHPPREGGGFEALPLDARRKAEALYHRYLLKHSHHLTQQRRALLKACALSNVWRLGNRSWSRRMRRLKGYRRVERRQDATGHT